MNEIHLTAGVTGKGVYGKNAAAAHRNPDFIPKQFTISF